MSVPAELQDAFDAYERALATDDIEALDDAFAPGPRTLRGDSNGLLVGHDAISAFRSGRGGITPRVLDRVETRRLADDCWLIVATSRYDGGGTGLQTQVWQLRRRAVADHRRARHRPHPQLRQGGLADGRRPALPGRVRRSPAGAARRGQGRVRRPRVPDRRGQPDVAARRRPRAPARPGGPRPAQGGRVGARPGPHGRARVLDRGREPALRHPRQRRRRRARSRAARRAVRRPRSRRARRTSGWPATPPGRSACPRATRACGGCARRTGWCRGRAWCRWRRRSTRSAG